MMVQRIQCIIMAVCIFAVTGIGTGDSLAQTVGLNSPDMLAIQGRWIRTDAPYVIELSHSQDGSLQAAYFNPRPIHVGKTDFAEQGGLLQIMIELQDVNYPGSTYVLSYDRPQDLLRGIYFHPESKQSYEVGFVRQVIQ